MSSLNSAQFSQQIKQLGQQLGFQAVGITDTRLDTQHRHYHEWIARNYHGEMAYMQRNIEKRLHPEQMHPGTLSVICVRLDYLPARSESLADLLDHHDKAYISRYALGRDYHKLMRKRLQQYAENIQTIIGDFGYRVFTDSAPVLEKQLAVKAGLGWRGKHSNILHRQHGSWFFLGEIYTDLKLPVDQPLAQHCGDCSSCMDKCPTQAIVAPYVVDARRCISYLTIEHHSVIAEEFREAIGNRIYGCDDCQIFCPWNRFETLTREVDFKARHQLDDISLLECFSWSEREFLHRFEGSAIRRIGYEQWRRNLAIALGNAKGSPHILHALKRAQANASALLGEHIDWAIARQNHKLETAQ